MLNRITPLLNRLVPVGLAYKGLQKLDPRIGKFLSGAAGAGYGAEEAIDFMRDKYAPDQNSGGQLRPDEAASNQQVENSKFIPKLAAGAAGAALGGVGGLAAGTAFDALTGEEQGAQQGQGPAQGNIFSQYSPELDQFIQEAINKGQPPLKAIGLAYGDPKFKSIIDKIMKATGQDMASLIADAYGGSTMAPKQGAPQQQQGQPQQPGQGAQQLAAIIQSINQKLGG